jgi:tetratricopeptide (TPR) repeat protein
MVLKTRDNLTALAAGLSAILLAGCGHQVPNGAASAATPIAAVSPLPGATPATPAEILNRIPDPGVEAASAREITRWREAARKQPTNATNWVNLGDALMQRSRELVDPHFGDYAEWAYQEALRLDPKKAPAMTGMAWVTGVRHQFDASIAWAEKAVALTPKDPAPYGLIGDAQVENGDYDAAFEAYQKMLDIRPDMSSYSRGAHLLYLTGDTRKALWLMNKAIQAGSPYGENTAWCRAQLAEMLWNTGALVPAEMVMKDALKSHPKNYHLLVMAGRLKEARGDVKGATECYEKAVSVSPQHTALVALGDLYLTTGREEEAERTYRKVEQAHQHHQTHGNHDEYYMARFFADHDRQLSRALSIVQSREPRSGTDADTAAWVYFKTGNLAEARKWIETALKKGAPDAARHYHAGMIFAAANDEAAARKHLYQALSLNSRFDAIHAERAASKLKELGGRSAEVKRTAQK